MNWNRAIGGGILGAVAMTVLMSLLRGAGVTPMNLEMMLGTMFTADPSTGAWILGFAIHLMMGALFGIAYGAAMEGLRHNGWELGVGLAGPHIVLAGLMMPVVAAMHPLVRAGEMGSPGFFAANLGVLGIGIFVAEHLMFGAIVGAVYSLVHEPEAALPRREARYPRRPPTAVQH